MADNNLMTAKVTLEIDPNKAMASAEKASKQLEQKLKQSSSRVSAQVTRGLSESTARIAGALEMASGKLNGILNKGFAVGSGLAGSSIFAFLKTGTPDALKFRDSLDRVKTSWARVGGILATKVNLFGGRTGAQWVEVLVNKLENLNTAQIEKAVGYFKVMAGLWAGLKVFQGAAGLAKAAAEIGKLLPASAATQAGAGAGLGTAGGAAALAGALSKSKERKESVAAQVNMGRARGANIAKDMKLWDLVRQPTQEQYEEEYARRMAEDNDRRGALRQKAEAKLQKRGRYGGFMGGNYLQKNLRSSVRNPVSGLVVAGSAAQSAMSIASDSSGSNVTSSLAKTAGVALGTGLAGPVGGAIALMIGEITDGISSALGRATSNRSWYGFGPKIPGQNVENGPLWGKGGQFGQSFIDESIKSNRATTGFLTERRFAEQGQARPGVATSTQQDVATATSMLASGEASLNKIRSKYDELDPSNALRTTLNEQIKIVEEDNAKLRDYLRARISAIDEQTNANKEFTKNMENFDKSIRKAKEEQSRAERDDASELKKFNKPQKPVGGTLTGGGIEDIPSLMSQAINEQANAKDSLAQEQLDKADELKEMLQKQDEDRKDREEALLELQKAKDEADKAFQDAQLKASETTAEALKRTGQQSNTVVNEISL